VGERQTEGAQNDLLHRPRRHRLLKLYGQEGERSFYVDSGTAINDEVDVIQFAGCYTAKGANSDDVRKKIVAAARYHGRFLDEKLEVTIRTTSY
jgi:hypothetical protein